MQRRYNAFLKHMNDKNGVPDTKDKQTFVDRLYRQHKWADAP
jgi:hypothetical protein